MKQLSLMLKLSAGLLKLQIPIKLIRMYHFLTPLLILPLLIKIHPRNGRSVIRLPQPNKQQRINNKSRALLTLTILSKISPPTFLGLTFSLMLLQTRI
jgi:hypothetical protein